MFHTGSLNGEELNALALNEGRTIHVALCDATMDFTLGNDARVAKVGSASFTAVFDPDGDFLRAAVTGGSFDFSMDVAAAAAVAKVTSGATSIVFDPDAIAVYESMDFAPRYRTHQLPNDDRLTVVPQHKRDAVVPPFVTGAEVPRDARTM